MKSTTRFLSIVIATTLMTTSVVFAQEETGEAETKEEVTEQVQESAIQEGTDEKVAGQDDAKEQSSQEETTEIDNSFEGLLARYSTVNNNLNDVKKQFDEAESTDERLQFKDQYSTLVAEANELVAQIRTAGIAKLEAGETDQVLFETLTGILINDASFQREKEAMELGHQLIAAGIDTEYFQKAADADRLLPSDREVVRELASRSVEFSADDLPRVKLTTSKGEIVLELFENEAPQTVANFISLVKDGFYDGVKFHRVLEDFMAQTGDPKGDGTGGPGYNIFCECYQPNYRRHFTGSLSMAKQVPRNTGGSQFFITFSRTSQLDGKHTVFGRVLEGMDVVNNIQRIDPRIPVAGVTADTIVKAEVVRDRGHEYKPTKVSN